MSKKIHYPPNRECYRCGANDIPVLQRSMPQLVVRLCGPCWRELEGLIRVWIEASLRVV